jgi:hypothetical protein
VDEVKWISLVELKEWYSKNPEDFLPTFSESLKIVEDYANQS